MARPHRTLHSRAAALVLVALVLGACGGTASPASSGGAGSATAAGATSSATGGAGSASGASGSAAGGPASASASSESGSPAAGVTDLCKAFTDAEITTFLGRKAHNTGTQAATTPTNCTWQDDNLTTVWVLKADADTCASDKEAIGSAGSSYPGADFAGPSSLGATFAGVTVAGSCFEIEVTPTERSPTPQALAALLQQFVQRVGA